MNTSENAMDSLLHLAEVAASMDPPAAAAAASAAPYTNAAQQLLNQPAAVVAALLQHQQQLQQQQHVASTAAQARTDQTGNDATALLQQLQRLKDALSQPTTGQKEQQQQQVSSTPLPRADAAMGSGSSHTMWHGASSLQRPGTCADSTFTAVGGLDDSLAGFMPIPSARISNSTTSSRPSAALQARVDTTVHDHYAADEYGVGLGGGKQHWTDEEQSELEMLVAYYGDKNWSAVASHLPGRSEKQCRERYVNRPAKPTKGGWTLQEEFKLAYLHSQYGSTWAQIARQMPGRSDNCLKNHWNAVQWCTRPGQAQSSSFFWLYTQGVQQDMAPADAFAAALSSLSAAQQASLAQDLAAATSRGAGGGHGESSAGGNSTAAAAELPHPAAVLPEGVHPAALPVQQAFAPQPEPAAPAQAQAAAEALAAAAAMVVAAAATQAKGGGISQPAAEALAAAAAAVARAVAAPADAQTNSAAGLPTSPVGHAAASGHSAAAAAAKAVSPGLDGSSLTPAALAQMLTASPQLQAELEACLQRHQAQQEQRQEEQRLAAEHQARLQLQKAREEQAAAAEAAAAAAAARQAFIEHQQALAEQAAAAAAAQQALSKQQQQQALEEQAAAAAAAAAAHQVYSKQQQMVQEQHMQQAEPSLQAEEQQLQQAGSKRKAAAKALSQQTEARLKRQRQSLQECSRDASGNAAAGVGAASDTAEPAVPAMPRAFQQALSAAAAAAAAGNGEAAAVALRQAASLAARTSSCADGAGIGLQLSADRLAATSSASAGDVLAPPSIFSALPSNGKTGLAALVSNLLASTKQKHHLQLQGARRADAAKLEAVLQNFTIGVKSSSAELSTDNTGTAMTQSGQQGHDSRRQPDGSDVQKMRKRQERMRNLVVGALSCTTAVPPVGKKQLAARRDRQRALEQFLASRVPLPLAERAEDQGPDMQMEQYGQMPALPRLLVQQQQHQHLCMPVQQQAAAAVRAPSPPAAAAVGEPLAPAAAAEAAIAAAPTQFDSAPAAAADSDQQEEAAAMPDTRAPAAAAAAAGVSGGTAAAAASSDGVSANSGAAATAAAHQVELMKLASTQEGKKLLESLKALGLLRTDLPPGAQLAIQLVVSPPEAGPSAAAAASAAIAEPTAAAAAAAVSTALSGNPPAPGSPDSNCSSKSSDPAAAVKLESQEQPVLAPTLKPGIQKKELTPAAVHAETVAPVARAACNVKVEAEYEAAVAASVSQVPAVAAGNAHSALASEAQEQQREVQRAQPGRAVVQQSGQAAVTEPEGAQRVGSRRPITAVLGGTALSAAISAAKRVLHNSPAWKEVKL